MKLMIGLSTAFCVAMLLGVPYQTGSSPVAQTPSGVASTEEIQRVMEEYGLSEPEPRLRFAFGDFGFSFPFPVFADR